MLRKAKLGARRQVVSWQAGEMLHLRLWGISARVFCWVSKSTSNGREEKLNSQCQWDQGKKMGCNHQSSVSRRQARPKGWKSSRQSGSERIFSPASGCGTFAEVSWKIICRPNEGQQAEKWATATSTTGKYWAIAKSGNGERYLPRWEYRPFLGVSLFKFANVISFFLI